MLEYDEQNFYYLKDRGYFIAPELEQSLANEPRSFYERLRDALKGQCAATVSQRRAARLHAAQRLLALQRVHDTLRYVCVRVYDDEDTIQLRHDDPRHGAAPRVLCYFVECNDQTRASLAYLRAQCNACDCAMHRAGCGVSAREYTHAHVEAVRQYDFAHRWLRACESQTEYFPWHYRLLPAYVPHLQQLPVQ